MRFKNISIFGFYYFCVLVSYLYVLNGDFIGDDITRILFNPELASYKAALTGQLGDRPILMLIVASITKAFGVSGFWLRLFGIAFHVLASMQLYFLTLEINRKVDSAYKAQIAFFVGLLFALHPLHNQVITTSIQMAVSIAAFFGVWSFRLFRNNVAEFSVKRYVGSLLLFAGAVLTKPIISFMPILFAAYWKRLKLTNFQKISLLASYIFLLVIPIVYYTHFGKNPQNAVLSPLQYFLVQTKMWFMYFKLILIPVDMQFLYDGVNKMNVFDLFEWRYFALHAVIIFIVHKIFKNRLIFKIFICIYIAFLPESGFFSIFHVAFDHRTYLPLFFCFLLLGTFFIQLKNFVDLRRVVFTFLASLCILYGILNQHRNAEVKMYRTWAIHSMENSHEYQITNFLLIYILASSGNFEEAKKFVNRNNSLYPLERYDRLMQIVSFFMEDEKGKKALVPLFLDEIMKSDLTIPNRFFINKVIIDEVLNKRPAFEEIAQIAKAYCYQIKFLGNIPLFAPIITNFVMISTYLLDPVNVDKLKKMDIEVYFLLRGVLVYYFNKEDSTLDQDIRLQMIKTPRSKVLEDVLVKISRMKKS